MDDHMKKEALVTALQETALTWYIKYCTDNLMASLADIQTALNKEFSRSKSEAQSIVGFKDIMMKPHETPWDLDQRLKCTIHESYGWATLRMVCGFPLTSSKGWFITTKDWN